MFELVYFRNCVQATPLRKQFSCVLFYFRGFGFLRKLSNHKISRFTVHVHMYMYCSTVHVHVLQHCTCTCIIHVLQHCTCGSSPGDKRLSTQSEYPLRQAMCMGNIPPDPRLQISQHTITCIYYTCTCIRKIVYMYTQMYTAHNYTSAHKNACEICECAL